MLRWDPVLLLLAPSSRKVRSESLSQRMLKHTEPRLPVFNPREGLALNCFQQFQCLAAALCREPTEPTERARFSVPADGPEHAAPI